MKVYPEIDKASSVASMAQDGLSAVLKSLLIDHAKSERDGIKSLSAGKITMKLDEFSRFMSVMYSESAHKVVKTALDQLSNDAGFKVSHSGSVRELQSLSERYFSEWIRIHTHRLKNVSEREIKRFSMMTSLLMRQRGFSRSSAAMRVEHESGLQISEVINAAGRKMKASDYIRLVTRGELLSLYCMVYATEAANAGFETLVIKKGDSPGVEIETGQFMMNGSDYFHPRSTALLTIKK